MSASDPRADPARAPLDVVPRPLEDATANGAATATGNGNGSGAATTGGGTQLAAAAPASATCASCGAPLAPDQRYCLACGQPASPVRLAFLDVLQGEYQPAALASHGAGIPGAPPVGAHYAPPPEPDGLLGALRRYSGLLALTGVLLAALLIGLLVGHWITGGDGASAVAGKQVIEVKGLSGALAAAPAPASTTGGAGSAAGQSGSGSASQSHKSAQEEAKQEAKEEAKEAKEVKAAKAPPPVQKKTNPTSLQKLDKTTGKQHVKEVNEQFKGDEPVETGH
ncbi:MAG TPA: hypothetical protein VK756_01200 [Solirubrobacteraceae bacterium]|nr:hypothetical protein [Solirubrobacteraceae bacterium]